MTTEHLPVTQEECLICGYPKHRHSGGYPNTCPIIPTYRPKARASDDVVELLEDVQFLLDEACHVPRVYPVNSEAVSRLGDKIGYGALMSAASAIWRIRLGDLAGGEFCCSPCRSTAENLRRRVDKALAALRQQGEG